MPRKTHAPEVIIAKLRQADRLLAQGMAPADVASAIGVARATYYRWRGQYGGLSGGHVRRLSELETICRALQ